jgi:hypothetical protein
MIKFIISRKASTRNKNVHSLNSLSNRKILLGDLNAKEGKEDILKQTIGNESFQEISYDNGIRVVNFPTS